MSANANIYDLQYAKCSGWHPVEKSRQEQLGSQNEHLRTFVIL